MLSELRKEFGVAARILVQILHPGGTGAVRLADLDHPLAFDLRRGAGGLLLELLPLFGLRTIAAPGDDERAGAVRIGKAEMQHGKPAHRNADDMRLREPQPD